MNEKNLQEYDENNEKNEENEENEEIIFSSAEDPMTEQEFEEQYHKLPMWQHVMLAILFLFGFTAIVMVIDFVVEFAIELLKHIF